MLENCETCEDLKTVHINRTLYLFIQSKDRAQLEGNAIHPYLGGHGLLVGDVHLVPDISGALRHCPDLLLGHVVFVVDVESQSIVYLHEAVQGVVEPEAILVISWQDGPMQPAHIAWPRREARVGQEEIACIQSGEKITACALLCIFQLSWLFESVIYQLNRDIHLKAI